MRFDATTNAEEEGERVSSSCAWEHGAAFITCEKPQFIPNVCLGEKNCDHQGSTRGVFI